MLARLWALLLAFSTSAGPLITEMRYQVSEINYWRSRNLNSLRIETYVNRRYGFAASELNRLDQAFSAGFLTQHNHLLNLAPQSQNPLELRPDWIHLSSKLDETLQALPAVEHMTYQGRVNANLARESFIAAQTLIRSTPHDLSDRSAR